MSARETAAAEKEQQWIALVAQKDAEIASLHQVIQSRYSEEDLQSTVQTAINRREEELRALVTKREGEVASAIARREEEIIISVNKREAELCEAWATREQQIREEVDERVQWILKREEELRQEEAHLQSVTADLEERMKKWEHSKGNVKKLRFVLAHSSIRS